MNKYKIVGASLLIFIQFSFAQVWTDSAGTSVQDGQGTATNRTGRGVIPAGTGSVGFDVGDIIVLPPQVAMAIRDLSDYFNGKDTIDAICNFPTVDVNIYKCPTTNNTTNSCGSSQSAEWVDIGLKNATHHDVFEYVGKNNDGTLNYRTGGGGEYWKDLGGRLIQKGNSVSSNFLLYQTQVTPAGNGWGSSNFNGLQVPSVSKVSFNENAFKVTLSRKTGYSFSFARMKGGNDWAWSLGLGGITSLGSVGGVFKACCTSSVSNIINYPVFKIPTVKLDDPTGLYPANFLKYKYIQINPPTPDYTESKIKTAYFAKHGTGSIDPLRYAVRMINHPVIQEKYQPYVDIDIDRAVFKDKVSHTFGAYTSDSHTITGDLFKFTMATYDIGGSTAASCSKYGCVFYQPFIYYGPLAVTTQEVEASPSAATFPFNNKMRCSFIKNP